MKRFLSFAGFAAVTLMALIACNEDTLMSEERAERTYEIVVKAEAQPTCAEEVLIIETLVNNNVDVEKCLSRPTTLQCWHPPSGRNSNLWRQR